MIAGLDLAVCAAALFCSDLQPSDRPDLPLVRQAACAAIFRLGEVGCAAQMAQEYGDHPDIAPARMAWALDTAAEAFTLAAAS